MEYMRENALQEISANLKNIKEAIRIACAKVDRNPDMVKLVAVSKNFPVETIKTTYELGQRLFGENRVQELKTKISQLPADIEWHLLGTLQRNKVKDVVATATLIHSVDSFALAKEISKQALKKALTANILLQVNIAGEESKHGFEATELLKQIKEMCTLPGIKIKGLMTIAPFVKNPEEVRPVFRQLKVLAGEIVQLKLNGVEMKELSMGMSNDFTVAVEEGATLVRIGSRIFGNRN
jgi:pyridoxal phosphate enzyme (YggS family)